MLLWLMIYHSKYGVSQMHLIYSACTEDMFMHKVLIQSVRLTVSGRQIFGGNMTTLFRSEKKFSNLLISMKCSHAVMIR